MVSLVTADIDARAMAETERLRMDISEAAAMLLIVGLVTFGKNAVPSPFS